MDEKIKNFDRSIEKMMNETAVAPPFGMWNRISAGLDAEVLPIATPAPGTAVPKSGMAGLVAGVLILGTSLLIAYLVNNNSEQEQITSETSELIVPYIEHTEPEIVIIEETKHTPVPVAKRVAVTKPIVVEKVEQEIPVVQNHRNYNHSEVAIPSHSLAQNSTASLDPYYFPPVDANNTVPVKNETATKEIDEDDDQPVVTEKKTKVSSYSGHEKKLRPKKKRSGSFSYGRINRYKNPK